jgi:hypothetical protein
LEADRASILESLGPARRFADPDSPGEARLMAARGALPLPPDKIAGVLFALTFDGDPEVKERATQSLDALPDHVLAAALGAAVHPALLAWFAQRHRENERHVEKLALNSATSDETICFVASLPYPSVIEIVAHNQVRLLRCPEILEALGENPLTPPSTIDRVLEFLGLKEEPEEQPEEAPEEAPAAETAERPHDLDDPSGLPPELLEEREGAAEGESEGETDEERVTNLLALIQNMKVIEKVKLARFGNAEARGILVRDRNKIVSTAAVRSPKVGENEVLNFAKARNLSEEVLRIISNNREWTRSYAVQLALATNPKTPIPSAIKFLNYLTDRDLKQIMRSRDVPGPVSSQARRILARKGKV